MWGNGLGGMGLGRGCFSINSGRLTVEESQIRENIAGSAGGAIAGLDFSAVTLRASMLTGNFAGGGGGGLAVLQVVPYPY